MTPSLAVHLAEALPRIHAPEVVLAATRHGVRGLRATATAPGRVPAGALRYELGSVTKTFTVLLLAELATAGALHLDDPLVAHLPPLPLRHPEQRRITLRHLATHTSGLPRLPPDLTRSAVFRPTANPYPRYDSWRLLNAFARIRPSHRAGAHWRYSNLGLALLGQALAHTTGDTWSTVLTRRVLLPLGLRSTGPYTADNDATGHRPRLRAPVPPTDMGAFAPAGGLRATPTDLLRYLEAHLHPDGTALAAALAGVQVPQLRRGARRAHTHTLTWYQHPAPGGPLLFHCGATFGQQLFLGLHPATGTGLAAACTRPGSHAGLISTAYETLWELCGEPSEPARTSAAQRAALARPGA